MQIISSQHFIDDETVSAKVAAQDFEVMVSPEFEYAGEVLCVVLDGHHSLAAAKLAGVAPEFVTADATINDKVALLARGEIEQFLEASWVDGDYYNIEDGRGVW